jgi:hypothetical protein
MYIGGLPRRDTQDREALDLVNREGIQKQPLKTYILLEKECQVRTDKTVPCVQPGHEAKHRVALQTEKLRHDNDKLYD